ATAIAYARQGMPGKAVSRLVDPPLAPDTPEVEQIMRSKFITPPASQMTSHRPLPPPANALSEADVGKAILSFQRGLGSGPSGTRPDFLRQVIAEKADKPGLALITRFCNLLADGQAPSGVRSYLAGANGFALEKEAKATRAEAGGTTDASMAPQNGIDARPVCSGEVWRRVVGKAFLASERDALLGHLLPHQLAVAVPAGQEVLPHLAWNWMRTFAQDRDRVLVGYDESNAHNEVDRHTFLTRMGVVVPGISRWLEFIYPTDEATFVFYQGRVIESRAGGQQGCPLIDACHAVVQRLLLEALGIVAPPPHVAPVFPILQPPAQLDMTPMFADDGFFAGQSSEVARALARLSPLMPSLGLRFSRLEAIPAAGASSTLDRDLFLRLGCTINDTQCVSIMKSPVGHQDFCDKTSLKRVSAAVKATNAISQLPDEHCALYLLRFQTARLDYLIRTTPAPLIPSSLEVFDVAVRGAFEQAVGIATSDAEWAQTVLPIRHAGLGLRASSFHADVAYVASHGATAERCVDIWPQYGVGPPAVVADAVRRINARLPDPAEQFPLPPDASQLPKQQQLSERLAAAEARKLRSAANSLHSARINAFSAPGASRWLCGAPSRTLDKNLSGNEVYTEVALQLGVDVHEKRVPCAAVALRRWTRKAGILDEDAILTSLRRPADVLVDGVVPGRVGQPQKVAWDVKVINALGPDHLQETLRSPLGAADLYRERALAHQDTEQRCLEHGVRYTPLVFTAQGGLQKNAEAVVSQLAAEIARVESKDAASVKADILQCISLSLARSSVRAVARRAPKRSFGCGDACSRFLSDSDAWDD
ncbi:unnamed protein product, partial [Polarella glacialis]